MHDLARRRTGRRLVGVDAASDGHQPPVGVLIVDDSAPFRTAARELLRRRGYVVVGEAGNATEAVEAAELLAPDAVLLDLHLPDGCGFEVSAVLTGARPQLAVLLISADDSPPPDGRVEACGARGFVPKSCLAATPLERFWPAP
jgi:DNA-binding NarL/FixJ family response regulator